MARCFGPPISLYLSTLFHQRLPKGPLELLGWPKGLSSSQKVFRPSPFGIRIWLSTWLSRHNASRLAERSFGHRLSALTSGYRHGHREITPTSWLKGLSSSRKVFRPSLIGIDVWLPAWSSGDNARRLAERPFV
jgi:hypothetical protein